jgi:hypothetical protein
MDILVLQNKGNVMMMMMMMMILMPIITACNQIRFSKPQILSPISYDMSWREKKSDTKRMMEQARKFIGKEK